MKDENDLSYLSAMYCTAAVLFLLTAVFAALRHSGGMAAACFILGIILFGYRARTSKKHK